ncbi:MAG: hypothetical protein E7254_06735 [Lachnospiraceae bacterium]|nr:hypothetical protein [Lachnospiraceae bacterium]
MNKTMKKTVTYGLTLALIVSMTSGVNVEAAKKKVKLNKTKATVLVGKTIKLKLKNAKGKVRWHSSDKKVATVSSKGKVKGIKAGKVTITAKNKGKKYKCKIRVYEKEQTVTTSVSETTKNVVEENTTQTMTTEVITEMITRETTEEITEVTTGETTTEAVTEETTTEAVTETVTEATTTEAVTETVIEATTTEAVTETTTTEAVTEENTEEPTEEASTESEYINGKYKKDVDILTTIIETQIERGAILTKDIDSPEYTWNDEGRLTEINWVQKRTVYNEDDMSNQETNSAYLSGDISFAGLDCLKSINCSNNSLTSIDVSQNKILCELYCSNNNLTQLQCSNMEKLRILYCYYNKITSLDVKNCGLLTELSCRNNEITNLNLENDWFITKLYCNDNNFTELDLSNCPCITEEKKNYKRIERYDGKTYYLDCYFLIDDDVEITYSNKSYEDSIGLSYLIYRALLDGEDVSSDFDSEQYEWSEDGRLKAIKWLDL